MIYTNNYESPLGNILLAGDEEGVTTTSYAGGLIMPLRGVVVFPPEGGV